MSIWKKPDEIPASCFLCVFDRPMGRSVGHYNPVKKQFCSGEFRFGHKDIDKFCMIDDLIAQADKAERLQKELEALKEFITKLYLNGNITDGQLERYKNTLKKLTQENK